MKGFFSFAIFILAISMMIYFANINTYDISYVSDNSYFMTALLFEESYVNINYNIEKYILGTFNFADDYHNRVFPSETILNGNYCIITSRTSRFIDDALDENIMHMDIGVLVKCSYGSIEAVKEFRYLRDINRAEGAGLRLIIP